MRPSKAAHSPGPRGPPVPRVCCQADVLLHRLHCALPGWDAAAERRDAQGGFHRAAQARAWADGDFDADHGLAFDGVGPVRKKKYIGPVFLKKKHRT
jgi:hypothetical protein